MKTIWKYELKSNNNVLMIPKDAEIIHVDTQEARAYIWAVVDSNAKTEARRICVFGTGHELPCGEIKHLGTFKLGPLVWHVMEVKV